MKTERLNEPPSPVDVAVNNIYVRDTVDTVDSVNSFMFFGIPQLGVKGSLGHPVGRLVASRHSGRK